jgi:hypothetical protein
MFWDDADEKQMTPKPRENSLLNFLTTQTPWFFQKQKECCSPFRRYRLFIGVIPENGSSAVPLFRAQHLKTLENSHTPPRR